MTPFLRVIFAVAMASSACSGYVESSEEPSGGGAASPAASGNAKGLPSDPALPAGANAEKTPNNGGTSVGMAPVILPPGTPPLKLASPTLRRLTVVQFKNALQGLFGATAPDVSADLESDSDVSGYLSVGAAQVALSARATEKFEAAGARVARQALTAADRAKLVGCMPAVSKDDACSRSFLTSFGRRAWRRPLTVEEINRYAALTADAAQALNDPWAGLEFAVSAFLQSPYFLYRQELGAADPKDPTRRILNPYELASRLAFFITNTPPDDMLGAAATAGKLGTPQELLAQTQRLLETSRARGGFADLFTEMLRLDDADDLKQLPKVFPLLTSTLGPAMRGETLAVLDSLVFTRNTDFREFFDGRKTFVNRELAKLYGLAAPAGMGMTEVDLPEAGQRRGLLGHGSILATTSHASTTSPTIRGKFVREVLLCQTVPPPPPGVSTVLPEEKAVGPRTMRQKLEVHAKTPACSACHLMTDPVGLGLEIFDGIGVARTLDVGLPIDPSGVLDGVAFADARALTGAVRHHPNAAACVVRQVLRYALGAIENDGQEAVIVELSQGFARDGYKLKQLATGLVLSVAFRQTGPLD